MLWQWVSRVVKRFRWSVVVPASMALLSACVGASVRYTSQDLALLPCETGVAPRFFQPIEFTESGDFAFKSEQLKNLTARLTPDLSDVVVFVHGWNKNPSLAERDYQDFLCRMHAEIREVARERGLWLEPAKGERLLVIGVFWPSTLEPNSRDGILLKVPSYFRMRARADRVAETGLQSVLEQVANSLSRRANLYLVGHSFGGRMLVRSLRSLSDRGVLPGLLQRIGSVNVVLLNAAVPIDQFEWILERILRAKSGELPARFSLTSGSGLYNIHSFNDSANRYLFQLASIFTPDAAGCAAGACGVPGFTTLCVEESGQLAGLDSPPRPQSPSVTDQLAAWNVDATSVVFDHTDIYKGRVSRLVVDLLFRIERERLVGLGRREPAETRERCPGSAGRP